MSLGLRSALAASILAAVVALGAIAYLLVSFTRMRSHTPARALSRALRSFVHEAGAIAITQPLVPLYYLVGRRMGGVPDGRPVVFVHGYFQNRADFVYLAHAARRARLGPLYGFNYDWTRSIADSAARLGAFVETVCRETGKDAVALVAHSLGGVVSVEYMATPEGKTRVARCVTIASPHAGVVWRVGMIGRGSKELHAASEFMRARATRALPVGVVSVFSTHDNIVHPSATSALAARGGEDVVIDDVGHLGMLFSAEVARATVRALAT